MTCQNPSPKYIAHSKRGLNSAISRGDGYTVGLDWTQAYSDIVDYSIAYNIYYSSEMGDVFAEGVKAVCTSPDVLAGYVLELTPGDTYYFAVRAFEYDPAWYNLALLPDGQPGFKIYPQALLLANISDSDTTIQISDIGDFPSVGIIQIGYELIQYAGKDIPTNSLLGASRGFLNTNAALHTTDGYDGSIIHDPPVIKFWQGLEDDNLVIHQETAAFEYPNYSRTNADGYKEETEDNLTTDLGGSDAAQTAFPQYDFSGYHAADPLSLLNGDCVGSYYGGELYCADGYGVGQRVRGLSIAEVNDQRQEVLLDLTGESCVLVRRLWKGKVCRCIQATSQNPNLRCPTCFGTGFVTGYEQYYNPRRSDGRIMVRFSPTEDDLKIEDEGLESTFLPDAWTLVVPAIKDRDFLIRFTEDGLEEFRYKVLNVVRNKLIGNVSGSQKLKLQRMRKTDPIYMWRAFRNTATMPQKVFTDIGQVAGPGGILPHTHSFVVNEFTLASSQINQTTSVDQGHNHPIINGVVQEVLGHTHTIVFP